MLGQRLAPAGVARHDSFDLKVSIAVIQEG